MDRISSRLDCEERLQRVGRAVVRLVRRPVIARFKSFRDVVLWRQIRTELRTAFATRSNTQFAAVIVLAGWIQLGTLCCVARATEAVDPWSLGSKLAAGLYQGKHLISQSLLSLQIDIQDREGFGGRASSSGTWAFLLNFSKRNHLLVS
jgi:hypothetical protein